MEVVLARERKEDAGNPRISEEKGRSEAWGDESWALSSELAVGERKCALIALRLTMELGALGPQELGLGRPPKSAGARLQNAVLPSELPPTPRTATACLSWDCVIRLSW